MKAANCKNVPFHPIAGNSIRLIQYQKRQLSKITMQSIYSSGVSITSNGLSLFFHQTLFFCVSLPSHLQWPAAYPFLNQHWSPTLLFGLLLLPAVPFITDPSVKMSVYLFCFDWYFWVTEYFLTGRRRDTYSCWTQASSFPETWQRWLQNTPAQYLESELHKGKLKDSAPWILANEWVMYKIWSCPLVANGITMPEKRRSVCGAALFLFSTTC